MGRPTSADYRSMVGFLQVALDNDGPEPFPSFVLDQFRRLIPCAMVHYREWDGRGGQAFSLSADEPDGVESAWSAYAEFRHQDPLPGGPPKRDRRVTVPVGRAAKFSDFLTLRAFRRLELHAEVCRPLGIDYVMKLFLPVERGGRSFVFDGQGRDFTERDRAVLTELTPHLSLLRRRAAGVAAVPATTGAMRVLSRREQEVLQLVASGLTNRQIATTLYISTGTVRKHLDNIYRKLEVQSRAAAVRRAISG